MHSPATQSGTLQKSFTATQNACKLCSPLGAALVFKGIEGAVPLLHGSQGCATYIRRYVISHFREPVDIACTNFSEHTAIFGGGANLKTALDNIRLQYAPQLIGVATTCLSETIGDDVPLMLNQYRQLAGADLNCPVVPVSTPSYRGTHMDGFHAAVAAVVMELADAVDRREGIVNVFPGLVSPADLRELKAIFHAFDLTPILVPDYSDTLDGAQWTEYQRIPSGGTPVGDIRIAGGAAASIELGRVLAVGGPSAGRFLMETFDVPCHRLGLPIGIAATDALMSVLEAVSGRSTPRPLTAQRGRLVDSYVDGHKYVAGKRVVVYGEEDLVAAMAGFLSEIGMVPVLCASGGHSGHLQTAVESHLDGAAIGPEMRLMDGADFVDVEAAAKDLAPDLIIGSSKGYRMARAMDVPLVRIGFPVHDRFGGQRLGHVGYAGTQELFDRVVNALLEKRQQDSPVGYGYQ